MPTRRMSEQTMREALDLVEECVAEGFVIGGYPSAVEEAARRAVKNGIARTTSAFGTRYRRAIDRLGAPEAPAPLPDLIIPEFPEEDVPIEEIIAHQKKRFEKRLASHEAHTWFPVTVKDNKPIGILWFGDPHLDDNGCDWTTLTQHTELCRTTDGLYGANIGDTTNNWAGRLIKLYANQDASVKTARRMAEWFMVSSGVRWLIWIIGNHDAWGDGAEILARMGKNFGTRKIVCHDWEARFSLDFPNGWKARNFAAHDFKGHSQWNPLHGPMKAGQMGEDADLYVCGHKHNAAYFQWENAARGGSMQHFVRVRGYKFMDDYARRGGYAEQRNGSGAVSIFRPDKQKVLVFPDVEEGADYLSFLRKTA